MSTIQSEEDRLVAFTKRPHNRKPSNAALWLTAIFFNGVALVLDIISAATVYRLTGGLWLYAVLTFVAGFLPLLLWEFAFLRAYASDAQRKIAIAGAMIAIVSVVGIGILSGLANAAEMGQTPWAAPTVLIVLVIVASVHGMLSAFYFYSDPGIRAQHTEAETVAYHRERLKNMQRSQEILKELRKAKDFEDSIIKQFGSRRAYDEIMRQLTGDDDNDGEPNYRDPEWRGLRIPATTPPAVATIVQREAPSEVGKDQGNFTDPRRLP